VLLASAVAIWFFAITQIAARNKQPIHYLMIVDCLVIGCIPCYFWLSETGALLRYPALIGSDVTAVYLMTPLYYLAALTILHEGKKPVRSYLVYLIPAAVFALGNASFNTLTAPAFVRTFYVVPSHFSGSARFVLNLTSVLLLVSANVAALVRAFRIRQRGEIQHPSEFRHQVTFLLLYLGGMLPLPASFLVRSDRLLAIDVMVISLMVVAYALSRTAVSYYAQERGPPAQPTWDSSAEELAARLDRLMRVTEPYREPGMTVRQLAHLLEVDPKRLSYHFRRSLATSYRGYVNEWRLQAAARDLLSFPDRSVIDVAFDAGFNSKSSFNTLFARKFGVTPREFRRANLRRVGAK
jgi:AraC-like DNA-binding protein